MSLSAQVYLSAAVENPSTVIPEENILSSIDDMKSFGLRTPWRIEIRALDVAQVGRAALTISYHIQKASENLPSIAPKPSVDIKHIRHNPDTYSTNCLERNHKSQIEHPSKIIRLFYEWRQSHISTRGLRENYNAVQSKLLPARTSSEIDATNEEETRRSRESLIEEARGLKNELASTTAHEHDLTLQINSLANELPNLTSSDTPRQEPRLVGYINEDLKPPTEPTTATPRITRDHVHLGAELDLLDFSGAAVISGWGWYFFKNEAALLEQALIQYAISVAMKHQFTVVTPPSMVYSHVASACGFRPRDQSDEQQIYGVQQHARDQGKDKPTHSLAATAEIPFAGMKANETIQYEELPIKVVGPSRCYRAEAGARGADTKGLYRVHEFTKVEMFAWTSREQEQAMFDSILDVQTEILTGLGLHCRILEMPSPDLGASAFRKRDIEAYFPSRQNQDGGWGEVTSTSICTDYQTRRLNTRVKNPAGSESKMNFPSTVNGTAVAIPRVLAAILEYGVKMRDDQISVRIPEVLWPWMHGIQIIQREKSGRAKSR